MTDEMLDTLPESTAPAAPAITLPVLTPAERRTNFILARVGTLEGWTFVEYVTLPEVGTCEGTGSRCQTGVRVKNDSLGGITKFVGLGFATKYLHLAFPTKARPAKSAKPAAADAKPAPGKRGRKPTTKAAPEVVELAADEADMIDQLSAQLGV